MKFNEYQNKANEFAADGLPDSYAFTNGASEMGETMGKFAKFQRKNKVNFDHAITLCRSPITKEEHQLRGDVMKELGDELWQLQRKATVCGFTLEELAESNIDKLSGRLARGTIIGSGDER